MRAGEVLKELGISRQTLMRWRRNGVIRAEELPNGHFEFNDLDVYSLKAKYKHDHISKQKAEALLAKERSMPEIEEGKGYLGTAIYVRTSIKGRKIDLDEQTGKLLRFAKKHKIEINQIYREYASGMSLDRTKVFVDMMENVLEGRLKRVLITSPDRLSRNSYVFMKQLFDKVGVEIVTLSPDTDLHYNREGASEMMRTFEMFDRLNPKIHIPAEFKSSHTPASPTGSIGSTNAASSTAKSNTATTANQSNSSNTANQSKPTDGKPKADKDSKPKNEKENPKK